MKSKKNIGSYYTPSYLSDFIMQYLSLQYKEEGYLSFFEPSVGDGRFVEAFNKTVFSSSVKKYSFTAIDKVKPELKKAQKIALLNRKKNTKYSFTKTDFLQFQKGLTKRFRVISGNPPYIKKQLLNKRQIEACQEIHTSANLSENSVNNIWSAFLIRCCQLLTPDGTLAFVLPAELLQVKFSAELRKYLTDTFVRTEIFTFSDLLFECKGQDTLLLIGFKKHETPGQFYTHISDTKQLSENNFTLVQNRALVSTVTKWSHHTLDSDDLNYIFNIRQELTTISNYCNSKPGIVTAANSFFIVNQDVEVQFGLTQYARPIIQRGLFVNGSIVFNQQDFENLQAEGKPTKILVFNDEDKDRLPANVQEYLKAGSVLPFSKGYKCKKRKNWFVIPNISTVPDGFFFKRSHHYPKLLKNSANVLVTDAAYKIEMKDGFELNSLIYSFYNSLTLVCAELDGRYYGGGVLELTPSEFKNLSIPYIPVTNARFESYINEFENKSGIEDILAKNDHLILNSSLHLTYEEIERVQRIYAKLKAKRFRKKAQLAVH